MARSPAHSVGGKRWSDFVSVMVISSGAVVKLQKHNFLQPEVLVELNHEYGASGTRAGADSDLPFSVQPG